MSCSVPTYGFDFTHGVRGTIGRVIRRTITPGRVPSGTYSYYLNDMPLARALGPSLTPFEADAIDIAVGIYVADRLGPRHDPGIFRLPGERWPRRMILRLPVRELGRWNARAVREGYEWLLYAMTGDDWHLSFVSSQGRLTTRRSEIQSGLFPKLHHEDAAVILNSGGLDAALGMVRLAQRPGAAPLVPVSVTTNSRAHEVQDRVVAALFGQLGVARVPQGVARVETHLHGVPKATQESTQRARSILYLTVGAVVAMRLGGDAFAVAEHGVGAINLPYTADQFGARTTKAVHPMVLAQFAELISRAADRAITIDNPLLWETKGEAIQSTPTELLELAKETVSCQRFPWWEARNACGICTNCFVRRASLRQAGMEKIDDTRRLDVDLTDPDAAWAKRDFVPLRAMRGQAAAIDHALAELDPWPALLGAYPDLADVVSLSSIWGLAVSEVEARLVRMYGSYVDEMAGLCATIARPGWRLDRTPPDAIRSRLAPTA